MVCHPTEMVGNEKKAGKVIMDLTAAFSVSIGCMSIVYRDNGHVFLLCMGSEEGFKFNMENMSHKFVGGAGYNMELSHPFRVLLNVAIFSFVIVVPLLYYKIFKFRKDQDISVQGNMTKSFKQCF